MGQWPRSVWSKDEDRKESRGKEKLYFFEDTQTLPALLAPAPDMPGNFSKARIRETQWHHPASLSGVHLQLLTGAPCRAVRMECFIDFLTSSSSCLLSRSANENNSLNQTFCSFFSHVWISEITGKLVDISPLVEAAYLQTGGSALKQELQYPTPHPPTPVCRFPAATAENCVPGSTPAASAQLSTRFRATFLDSGAQGKHFGFSQEIGSSCFTEYEEILPHMMKRKPTAAAHRKMCGSTLPASRGSGDNAGYSSSARTDVTQRSRGHHTVPPLPSPPGRGWAASSSPRDGLRCSSAKSHFLVCAFKT